MRTKLFSTPHSAWLHPVRCALDSTPHATFFLRDDDGGWGHEQLRALLRCVAAHDLPIDLAIIPEAVTAEVAGDLRVAVSQSGGAVRLHQHGLAHVNHEIDGRKSEFGPSRSDDQVRRDVARGRARLFEHFGPLVDPVFTPPWNRCTTATAECLRDLGVRVLSRDASAPRLQIAGLREQPVHLDWSGRRGARLGLQAWGRAIAAAIAQPGPVGLLLHHAVMSEGELSALRELLGLLASHPAVRVRNLIDVSLPSAALQPSDLVGVRQEAR